MRDDVPAADAQRRAVLTGTLYAAAAGLMWGLVFIAPTLLADYPAALLVVGRYLAFGLIALPLAWWNRLRLAELSRADWLQALKLSAVGNLLYYLCLPWARLAPSLLLIAGGIACVNQAELQHLQQTGGIDLQRYAEGALLALAAVACWTWYPIRNADWLRAHSDRSATTWATAQGLATLPLALAGSDLIAQAKTGSGKTAAFALVLLWGWTAWQSMADVSAAGSVAASVAAPLTAQVTAQVTALPFGPRPAAFIGLMLVLGFFASWLGTLCWNKASQRLPPALSGQLIVFETLAALAYAFALRGQAPQALTLFGIVLLMAGVVTALRSGRPALRPM